MLARRVTVVLRTAAMPNAEWKRDGLALLIPSGTQKSVSAIPSLEMGSVWLDTRIVMTAIPTTLMDAPD